MRLFVMLLSLCVAALPAAAQDSGPAPTLSIALGETVTARITPDGRFVELSRVRRPASADRPAPDTVSFTLFELAPGRRAMLNSSGYRDILSYRSRAFVRDQALGADECLAVPVFASVQTWREPIDRVELSEPHPVAEGEMRAQCG
jgi:hypothetical protein